MGRHSKGRRALLGCRAPERLDQTVRSKTAAQGMTINDYVITVLANELQLPEEAPHHRQGQELPLTGLPGRGKAPRHRKDQGLRAPSSRTRGTGSRSRRDFSDRAFGAGAAVH